MATFNTFEQFTNTQDNSGYGRAIAQAQDCTRKAILFCEIENEARAEGNIRKALIYSERAALQALEGDRLFRAAQQFITGKPPTAQAKIIQRNYRF